MMKLLAGLMLLARVEEMRATVVHAPDIKLPGWKAAMTGKCRGGTANVVDVTSYDELVAAIDAGKWARGGWEGSDEDEKRVKEETGATIRCFPFEQPAGPHACIMTGAPAKEVCIFAKSY